MQHQVQRSFLVQNVSVVSGLGQVLDVLPDIWHLCEPGVPGPGLHHHAGVHLEQAEPQRQDEFLRPAQLPGALLALGADGILSPAGQLHHRGSSRCPLDFFFEFW